MNTIQIFRLPIYIVLILAVGLSPSSIESQELEEGEVARHCTARLESPEEPGKASEILQFECFDTFQEAVLSATDGRVFLPSDVEPATLTDEDLNGGAAKAGGPYVIAIEYNWKYYRSGGGTFTWSADKTCLSTSYHAPWMPPGWNNKISSTKSYSYCTKNALYDYTNQGGDRYLCWEPFATGGAACKTVGSLNNDASSRRWYR